MRVYFFFKVYHRLINYQCTITIQPLDNKMHEAPNSIRCIKNGAIIIWYILGYVFLVTATAPKILEFFREEIDSASTILSQFFIFFLFLLHFFKKNHKHA